MTISNAEVKLGYEICKSHIEILIESSQLLYDSKKYSISLALSILAREEEAKLIVLQDHVKNNENMKDEEWKQLTKSTKQLSAHEYRLTHPAKKARENVQRNFTLEHYEMMKTINMQMGLSTNVTYEQLMSLPPDDEKILQKLDKVKQACFYVGRNGNWTNFSLKLRSKEEEKALAYTNLMQVKGNYYSCLAIRLRKEIKLPINETLKDDPNFQKYVAVRKEMELKKYQTMMLLAHQALSKFK